MSEEVFSRRSSVFFVCDGIVKAGGCTLDYVIENGGFADFDKSLIMDGAGDPIVNNIHGTYDDATGIISAGGGYFNANMVGMVVYIEDDGNSVPAFTNPGRYEITAADSDTITIESGLYGESHDADLSVYVGGSFDTLSNALDNITANDAGGKHDCYLFTNHNEVVTARPQVTGGGNIAHNSKLFITGFNTTLLDMCPGGAYYQSAYDAWKDGIDADCHTTIDLDDIEDFYYSADCVITQNLRITNCPTSNRPVEIGSSTGIIFNNCIIDDGDNLFVTTGTCTTIILINCYLFNATNNLILTSGAQSTELYIIDCVIDAGDADVNMIVALLNCLCIVTGCLLVGGKGLFVSNANWIEWNNTIIGHATHTDLLCYANNAGVVKVGWGDLIVLPQAAEVIELGSNGGCSLWQGFSVLWGSDNAEYTGDYMLNAKSGGNVTIRDFNTIDVDPDLDANYRPRNPQVLRGGPAMLSDGRSQLGAIKQKYQFPQKGRLVNHGRLGILK